MKLALLAVLVFLSCGPSTRDVALAKVARYHGDKLVLFNLARGVAEKKYQLVHSDETQLVMQTKGHWYMASGLTVGRQPGDESLKNQNMFAPYGTLPDKALYLELTIKLLPDAENWIVYVNPTIRRYNQGMPNLEPVDPKHADTPTWVTGRVDTLAWEIHRALHKYQVPGLTGSTPEPPPYVPDVPADAPVDEPLELPPVEPGHETGPPP